jgi:hypothetical protein
MPSGLFYSRVDSMSAHGPQGEPLKRIKAATVALAEAVEVALPPTCRHRAMATLEEKLLALVENIATEMR